jgi:hypothetical protein
MIKLKDILNERISSVVYHFTTTDAAGGIIDSNSFRLSEIPSDRQYIKSPFQVDAGIKYDKGYYMSVSRTKIEGYTTLLNSARCHFVRFELDGNKLGNTYKGGPFDYFPQHQGNNEYEEYEDRIYSRNKVIPNARGYIKRMDLDVSRECPRQELDGGFNPKVLIEIATGAGVPTFIFPSRYKWGQQSGGIQIKSVEEYENLQIDYNTGLFVPVTVKQGKI